MQSLRSAHTGRTGRNAASMMAAAAGSVDLRTKFGQQQPTSFDMKAELVTYVAASGVPFATVEAPPFVSLVEALRPRSASAMVGRAAVSRAMPALREQVLKAIEGALVEATGDKDFVRDVELEFHIVVSRRGAEARARGE